MTMYTFSKKKSKGGGVYLRLYMIDILLQKRGVSRALAHVSVLQIDFFVGNSGVWITHYSIMLEINGWNTDLNHSSRLCPPPPK